MRKLSCATVLFYFVLAACSSSTSQVPPFSFSPASASRPAQGTAPHLWVVDLGSNKLKGYLGGSSPEHVISGSYTLLNEPAQVVANNQTGELYVSNASVTRSSAILVFSNTADGNVAPARTISSSYLGPQFVSLALDPSQHLWVGNEFNSSVASDLVEFAKNASGGNVTPIAVIHGSNTGFIDISSIATDSAGNIYACDSGDGSIKEFAAGSNGNVSPIRVINGTKANLGFCYGLAVDSNGYIIATQYYSDNVKIFGPNQSGNVYPHAVISGYYTGLQGPFSAAVDAGNNIYIGDDKANQVFEYAAGSNGNVAPIRTITNGINEPWGVSICQDSPPCER